MHVDKTCVALISDAVLDDSDKSFTVPDREDWRVRHVFVQLISTGNPGNRRIRIQILNAAGAIVAVYTAGAVQVASKTGRYNFGVGNVRETAFTTVGANDEIAVPWPDDLIVPSGFQIQVLDVTAVDAAADDLTVRALGDRLSIG